MKGSAPTSNQCRERGAGSHFSIIRVTEEMVAGVKELEFRGSTPTLLLLKYHHEATSEVQRAIPDFPDEAKSVFSLSVEVKVRSFHFPLRCILCH